MDGDQEVRDFFAKCDLLAEKCKELKKAYDSASNAFHDARSELYEIQREFQKTEKCLQYKKGLLFINGSTLSSDWNKDLNDFLSKITSINIVNISGANIPEKIYYSMHLEREGECSVDFSFSKFDYSQILKRFPEDEHMVVKTICDVIVSLSPPYRVLFMPAFYGEYDFYY